MRILNESELASVAGGVIGAIAGYNATGAAMNQIGPLMAQGQSFSCTTYNPPLNDSSCTFTNIYGSSWY